MIPETFKRVEEHTSPEILDQIRRETDENIARYRDAGPEVIGKRLEELEAEWDIERLLETNAATFVLMGLGLGIFVDRRWLLLPVAVSGFLLQHAIQGWCPPVPVFRKLGFRTAAEIQYEVCALRSLRGDFEECVGPNVVVFQEVPE